MLSCTATLDPIIVKHLIKFSRQSNTTAAVQQQRPTYLSRQSASPRPTVVFSAPANIPHGRPSWTCVQHKPNDQRSATARQKQSQLKSVQCAGAAKRRKETIAAATCLRAGDGIRLRPILPNKPCWGIQDPKCDSLLLYYCWCHMSSSVSFRRNRRVALVAHALDCNTSISAAPRICMHASLNRVKRSTRAPKEEETKGGVCQTISKIPRTPPDIISSPSAPTTPQSPLAREMENG